MAVVSNAGILGHLGETNGSALLKIGTNMYYLVILDYGIQFRISCPHTSQQNGKAERIVRTINNIVCTLLFQANLPPSLWAEAFATATHILNLLPIKAIGLPPTKHPILKGVVDCIISLKSYHELKEYHRGSGISPKISPGSKKFPGISNPKHASPCRRLDLSVADEKISVEGFVQFNCLFNSLRNRDLYLFKFHFDFSLQEPVNQLCKILFDCLEGQLQINVSEVVVKRQCCMKLLTRCFIVIPYAFVQIAKTDVQLSKFEVFVNGFSLPPCLQNPGGRNVNICTQGYQKVIKENNLVQDLKILLERNEDGSQVLVDPSNPKIRRQINRVYGIHVEMIEKYYEQVRDLLAQELSSNTLESASHASGDGAAIR
ncbi:LOW QUALITY PROTEIN: hypothetical protein V2J09_005664 [Rumex salicifolius]